MQVTDEMVAAAARRMPPVWNHENLRAAIQDAINAAPWEAPPQRLDPHKLGTLFGEAFAQAFTEQPELFQPGQLRIAPEPVAHCCICGSTNVVYFNYLNHAFCIVCVDGEPAVTDDGVEGPGVTDATGNTPISIHEPDTSQVSPTIGPNDGRR